ncbi:MAG: hypothetical protein KDC85_01450 [Saprospiraceae bacterium]|nr:hypothetical protein [Saprospiraceae bacterium]MCB9322102.1 hypothetical protein [Lewinellaceae bacterium]
MPKKSSKSELVNNLIRQAKKEELVKLVQTLVDQDSDLEMKIRLFLSGTKQDKPNNYRKIVAIYLRSQTDKRYGMLKWHALSETSQHFERMIQTLSAAGKTDELLNLCVEIVVQVNGFLHNSDDSYGYLSNTIAMALNTIHGLLEAGAVDDNRKLKLFEHLLTALDDKHIYDFDAGGEIWNLLAKTISSAEEYEIFSRKMADSIKDLEPDSTYNYQKELMIVNGLAALQTLGMEKAAEELILDNLKFSKIRKILVYQCIAEKDFSRAKDLIEEGIKIATKEKHPGTVSAWEAILLEIALKENDIDGICRQAKLNLLNHPFNLNNFLLYKKYSPKEKWKNRRDEIIETFEIKRSGFYHDALVKILKEEKMYDKLFEIIAGYGSNFYILDEYAAVLIAHDKEKLIELYLDRIKKFLEDNTGRQYYKVAARYLKKVKKMGASQKVDQLVNELRQLYNRRPALLQEIQKI